MKGMLLVMSTMVWFVAAEVFLGDVDEPIPMLEISAVAGFKAKIPCDIDPGNKREAVSMVFWYKDQRDGEPIYRVDARRSIDQASLWSDPNIFGERATMKMRPAKLEIDPLEAADAGVYRCRVDYKNSPTRNQKVNLTVIVPPNKPVIYTSDGRNLAKVSQPFNEGSELSLLCEVIGGSPPPKVTWHFEGEMLNDTYTYTLEHGHITINRLDISNVTRNFLHAKLICQARNTHLLAPVTSEIILDINLKPLIVNITNKRAHLSALSTYDIECVSSGSRPKVVITWWKGIHQVKYMAKIFEDSSNITRSVLSYVPTMGDDGKHLICRAENSVLSNSALEDRWRLLVFYAPKVTIRLGSNLKANDITEGNDVYFECKVQANPEAYKLVWYKDGKELYQNATARIFLPSGQSLVLRSVTRNSAGEYFCMAVNDEGKSTSESIKLDIMYAPICISSTQVVGALKHETISLVCGVQAKPPPTTFHWTFNNSGELMNVPADRFTQAKPLSVITNHWNGSRLNYTPVSDMDYGTVACWAENRIGVQKTPCLFQIIVAGKPYPLQNCTAVQSTGPYAYRISHEDFKATDSRDADWLIVRCSEGFDGGLPVTNYELEVYSEENVYPVNTFYPNHTERSSSPGPVFEIPGLEPGRKYRLHLYAVNAKGRSDPVVLEPVTLKAVAMYTTDRGTSDDGTDYSLLVACFAGGVTAVCILIVGITLTLYRRNHPMQPIKTHTVVQYGNKEGRVVITPLSKESRDELKGQLGNDTADDDPDVIPNKTDKRPDIFEPNYEILNRSKDFTLLEERDYPSPSSMVYAKDSWIYPNGYVEKVEKSLSPLRPSTLPVHRSHDIYTRSSRLQESCI
ncbi:hemicentin-2-like [Ceratina calcarata]|uniref:Hemicentin-2-like n=1 Tax=Ceratina calcarata TaxID=156304 RepID=A0AAJ7IY08_9HYME|nr:hemicentin-2-like [Ceratina calcarata]